MSRGITMEDLKKGRKEGKNLADITREKEQVAYFDRPDNEKDICQLERMRNLENKLKYY